MSKIAGRIIYNDRVRMISELEATSSSWDDEALMCDEDPITQASIGGSSGQIRYVDFDFDTAQTIDSLAIINHNLYARGYQYVLVYVGSTDDGTFDTVLGSIGSIQVHPEYEPSAAYVFTEATKRYWRLMIGTSGDTEDLTIGVVMLGNHYDFEKHPIEPFGIVHDDFAGSSRGLAGIETMRGEAPAFWSFSLAWQLSLGGASGLRTELRSIYDTQSGRLSPVAYIDHRREGTTEIYPCSYCRIDKLQDGEVLNDGTDRRYDIKMQFEEITFDGLL